MCRGYLQNCQRHLITMSDPALLAELSTTLTMSDPALLTGVSTTLTMSDPALLAGLSTTLTMGDPALFVGLSTTLTMCDPAMLAGLANSYGRLSRLEALACARSKCTPDRLQNDQSSQVTLCFLTKEPWCV